MRGVIAPRVDDAIAKAPACTATSTRISQTLPRPSSVWASRPSVISQVTIEDQK